jgi:hypothetical protein
MYSVLTASVVKWVEFLATDPEVPASVPCATRFSEKQWVWNGVLSPLEDNCGAVLKEKVAGSGQEIRD